METTITRELINEVIPTIFGENWILNTEKSYVSKLSEDKRREVFLRLELWHDDKLVNFAEHTFELNESFEGTIKAQVLMRLGEMRNDKSVTQNPMK